MRWGLLAPGLVLGGAALAGVGVWYWLHVQPRPGAEIDRVPCTDATMVVYAEQDGERSFVELHDPNDQVVWQALIPHYAGSRGRPAIACGATAATVRVERSGRSEVFGFLLQTGEKIGGFRLAPEHQPIAIQPTGPITLTDHLRSYEFVGGADWHQVVAVDLASGKGVWKADLGPAPVTAARLAGGQLVVDQGASERSLELATGRDETVTKAVN